MKCPKCGYTSFDYLDECRKCRTDLRDVRTLLQIIAISPEERAPVSRSPRAEADAQAVISAEQAAPLFGEDLGSATEAAGPESFEELDFEDSFEGMVERTSYESSSPATNSAASAKPAAEEEDELLDLDFGDLFAEKGHDRD